MELKIYTYAKCGTCRKAIAWLEENAVAYRNAPIRERPPSKAELRKMLTAYDGNIRKLFNSSGQDYKALNMKERLPDMSEEQALALLAGNGNLIKRPFAIGDGVALVGFDEDAWRGQIG